MPRLLTILLLVIHGTTALAATESNAATVRILDEASDPIAGARVYSADSEFVANEEGRVELLLGGAEPASVRIEADGYFPMVHTLGPEANQQAIPDIRLVERKSDRRLLLFAGDSMLSRRYFEPRAGEATLVREAHAEKDARKLLQLVKPYLELADVASVNVETALSNRTLTNPVPKSVTFYSPNELADVFAWAGFDYAALGNNHSFDFREPGVISTLAALESTELAYSGAGLDEAAARAPASIEVSGRTLAYLSYVGWPGTFTPTQTAAGEKGGAALGNERVFAEDLEPHDDDISVLQLHAGLEYAEAPAMSETSSLRSAVDSGADVVIAHHPHVLQGLQVYQNRLIAYSMGNFLFDQYIYSTQGGMLLYVWMDGEEFHRAEIVPLNINGYIPTPAVGAFRYWVLNRLARLSEPLGTCLESSGMHAVVTSTATCTAPPIEVECEDSGPIALWREGNSPVRAVGANCAAYRVGVDLLPRGDFEAAGRYGVPVRAWLLDGEHIGIRSTPNGKRLALGVGPNSTVRTGMKVFERSFSVSTPATVSGRVRASGPVKLTIYMQRRRTNDGLSDALQSGPLTEIGSVIVSDATWQQFSLNHSLPRLATKSVRILVDIENQAEEDVQFELDDLAWVEWRTPWLRPDEDRADFGTHIEFRLP